MLYLIELAGVLALTAAFHNWPDTMVRILAGAVGLVVGVVVAAIILWNTRYLEAAYGELRRQGRTVNENLLRHVAPLGWEHIGLTGDYVWSDAEQSRTGTLRPLRQRQSLLAA